MFGKMNKKKKKNKIMGKMVDNNGGVINIGSIFIKGNKKD